MCALVLVVPVIPGDRLSREGTEEQQAECERQAVLLEEALQWRFRPMIEKYVIPAAITTR
jgi:hypothetical protein